MSCPTDPREVIAPEAVRTCADFAAFLDHLRADLLANPDAWENADLPRFLEAMAAYVRAYPNRGRGFAWALHLQSVNWKQFAEVLAAARVYE